jgi:poly(A) polymerase
MRCRALLHTALATAAIATSVARTPAADSAHAGWTQSYAAGYADTNGIYAGGSEIMHIVSHRGVLYAFNGFWKDRNFGKHSAQVLRLDSSRDQWQVDLETTPAALGYKRGNIMHMKGNILKSVIFGTDKTGRRVDVTLLVAASWAFNSNEQRHQAVSFFTRDDSTGTWSHTILQEGPRDLQTADGKTVKVRRVPRDIEVYRDPETGIDRIFMLIGDPGILSGVYNSATGRIEWDSEPEHPGGGVIFPARPLGIAQANGKLYFSVGGRLFVRHNGKHPSWTAAHSMSSQGVNTDLGGIRGLSTVDNPGGPGESLIFVWTPRGRSPGQVKRLDGVELKEADETSLRELYNRHTPHPGTTSTGSLGGYNRFLPITNPRTGKIAHLVGYEQTINTRDPSLAWHRYYKGALYGIRLDADTYSALSVNGRWNPSKPVLVAPRTFAHSPFPDEKGWIYFGGHDANFQESTDMAWIFKAPLDVVLGTRQAP